MIKIRHAELSEKYKTYEWLYLSDTTPLHISKSISDWNQFNLDYENFYYDYNRKNLGSIMIIDKDGEEIGCIRYSCFHLKPGRAELDVWLKAKKYCGSGYGTDAIKLMINYLKTELNINKFIISPSADNKRAIRSYKKAGFRAVTDKKITIKENLLPKYITGYVDENEFEKKEILTNY